MSVFDPFITEINNTEIDELINSGNRFVKFTFSEQPQKFAPSIVLHLLKGDAMNLRLI